MLGGSLPCSGRHPGRFVSVCHYSQCWPMPSKHPHPKLFLSSPQHHFRPARKCKRVGGARTGWRVLRAYASASGVTCRAFRSIPGTFFRGLATRFCPFLNQEGFVFVFACSGFSTDPPR